MLRAFKRRLLPAFNASLHALRLLGDYLLAAGTANGGNCDICGRFSLWLYRRRVIPRRLQELWGLPENLAKALARKESSDCVWCGGKLRARRLAQVVLEEYPTISPSRSIRQWAETPEAQKLRIGEFNRIEGLHEQLLRLPGCETTDFHPEARPGEVVHGVRSEDLTHLTYLDNAFDLILTSETLEHVPDLHQALAEIHRVLAPEGRHIFTIPRLPGVSRTFDRARLLSDGQVEPRATPIRHPGGDVGYPVFTEFGADFEEILAKAGFEVETRFGPVREDDIAQVFLCRKR